eukprot:GHVS01098643.1.p1 GENE.GHVS01098643.1~~GHVS01098643.1.p1  ORF type:complete len:198 (-),score=5.41 GHVS01098643.1:202-795(-)
MSLIRMFLLSRRSAVFALFVILAFATSTLLAHIPSTVVPHLLNCFDMSDDTSWPVVSMRNAFYANKGVFTIVELGEATSLKSIAFSLRAYKELGDLCIIEHLESPITDDYERGQQVLGRDPGADHYRPFAFQYHLHNATIKKELFSKYSILTFSCSIEKLQETSFRAVENCIDGFLKFELKRGENARLVEFKGSIEV